MYPPRPPRRPATRRDIVFAVLAWPALVALFWFGVSRWALFGALYVALGLALLAMIGIAVAAVRGAVRGAGDVPRGQGRVLLREFGVLLRQIYTAPWQTWFVRLLGCLAGALLLLAAATGAWQLLAWAGLCLAGIVAVGMAGLLRSGGH